jgi:ribosome biogenesis GTPase / thiamine phosphate phosphatase
MQNPELAVLGWNSFFSDQISPAEANRYTIARVIAVHKYAFTLATGPHTVLPGVMAGKARYVQTGGELPVVGDWILSQPPVGGTSVIIRRLERRSSLSRRRPLDRNSSKTTTQPQVLAANVDLVFIVSSLNQDLNVARLERALTLVWNSGATPVLLLSKADLCPEAEARAAALQAAAAGANVHPISSLQNQGLDVVRAYLRPGVTGCLLGSSGAGKTTLLNALCSTEHKTLAIRADDDKGRHATSARALFFLPDGGMLIDTPGLREIGLLDESDLAPSFADIAELAAACRFADCAHQTEPGCAVLAALADGRLERRRYDSYLKLRREVAFQAGKQQVDQHLETKKKQKKLSKLIKGFYKNRF